VQALNDLFKRQNAVKFRKVVRSELGENTANVIGPFKIDKNTTATATSSVPAPASAADVPGKAKPAKQSKSKQRKEQTTDFETGMYDNWMIFIKR
jgi:serine acetyltransferase